VDQVETHRYAPIGNRWIAELGLDYTSPHGSKPVRWTDDPDWEKKSDK
jgi:hypothetical protein